MKKINQTIIPGFFLLLLLALSFPACQKESEQEIAEKEVPQAVLQSFARSFPGAKVNEYAKENEKGKTSYEISCVWQGQKMDVSFDENGTITNKETTIEQEDLPTAVQENLAKDYGQYKINTVERLEEEGKILYEIKISKGDEKYELVFTEDGKLDKKEQMKGNEEEGAVREEQEEMEGQRENEEHEQMEGKEEREEQEERAENEEQEERMMTSEKELKEQEVPQAVLQSFAGSFPGAKVNEYAKENEGRRTSYEISCLWQGKKIDVSFDENGTITNKETTIEQEDLPTAVQENLAKDYSQFKINTVEKLEEEGKILYEIKISKGDEKYELVFTRDGKLDKKEQMKRNEEEKDE